MGDRPFQPASAALLVRVRARTLSNRLREVMTEAPVKVFATAAFIGLIWIALYQLFVRVFGYFQTVSLLQSAVAIPLVFHFFFVALLVLLTLSNAILAYGALFTHEESAYLLSSPLKVSSTVLVKYGESLFFSSWSLLLLGMPLMMAIARVYQESWLFYPLFIVLFLAFVPIPGAMGMFLAWLVARFLPRSARRLFVYASAAVLLATVVWGLQSVHEIRWISKNWLDDFFARMSLVQIAILPSTWVTRGIEAALNAQWADCLRYLSVTVANALFLSWLAVHVVSYRFLVAYDRASTLSTGAGRFAVAASGGVAGRMFFFLPHAARLIAAKDMRHFVRDPVQWSQLAILFGLMALYLLYLPRFDIDDTSGRWSVIVPFLNLTAISFILATFTSRFVFPLVSMERHQFWLLGLLPVSRFWILVAKFSFAFTVTFSVASAVIVLASYILQLSLSAMLTYLGVIGSVCFGLCGLAVGIGARLPVLTQCDAARIANGLGGTINLIASVMLIVLMLAGMAWATHWFAGTSPGSSLGSFSIPVSVGVMIFGVTAGTCAMIIGSRHLNRMEL